ncbi:hypothetical protein [Pseudoalteromonas luteoviolacea]|uniref:hypothetical protein n=1 Tax=Pseudoalteromonas luteoviolacea TaxID=43657 RepID=UPI001B36916C|nr:hypothetical protein [Pseudoalteromonas luteoviolacea]MBQ4839818.1 hypothetical protein [Pseudoalteromonas luteoviolacea]
MDLHTAFFATFSIVLITQLLKQVLPNCFAFPWQLGLHEIVPKKYIQHRWFKDTNSLFYFSKDEIIFHTFPLLSQSNLRYVALLGGLNMWMFLNVGIDVINIAFEWISSFLITVALFMVPFKIVFSRTGFNPDYIVLISFDLIGYLIALQFVMVSF